MPTRVLYLCYFGIREPLVQTQVLPYLREIRRDGMEVSLLTFERNRRQSWPATEEQNMKARLSDDGIKWFMLTYHKSPSAIVTPFDILRGALAATNLLRRDHIDVLHARGHVPALMGALAKKFGGGHLLFDIRGFLPEEYTDAGIWPKNGYLYRSMKRVERYLFSVSDAFVVLTERAREILFPGQTWADKKGRPIEVIPCCVDRARFQAAEGISREEARRRLQIEGRRVIAYVGSFGGWYLTDEMISFLGCAHRQEPTTFSMILTQSPEADIVARLRAIGLTTDDFFVGKVESTAVPEYLRAADFAISFIKPCYSKFSSSPTKIAEYLASGLPVVCNKGVGDLDELLQEDRIGITFSEFSDAAYEKVLKEIETLRRDTDLEARCRASARKRFDLTDVGGFRYRRLYKRMLEGMPARFADERK